MESNTEGWVVVDSHGDIKEFTFSAYKKWAIQEWLTHQFGNNDWKTFYRKGCRCVRATRTITIEK